MSVKVETLEKNMAKLTIEVSAEELEKGMQVAYNKNKNKISIPGFRKGKVPRQMIEKMYGPGFFYEDAANEILPGAYSDAVEESKLEIVSQPSIDIVQIEKGKPFVFTAEVAVKPEVTLGEYKGIEIPAIDRSVSDEDIEKEVDKERENNARMVAVTDRPVEKDDIAVIDFEGFVGDEAFEGGKGENYSLTIGSGSFIPGFEDQLIGTHIGDEPEVNVTFPEDYSDKSLAGKKALFKCKIHEIKIKELPEADDDFAQDVSKFDTILEYRDDIKKNLEEKKEADAKREKEDAVIKKIIENASMDIPEPMIESQTRQMVDDFARRLQSQGLTFEQYMQFTGMTPDKINEQMKPDAVKRIQSRLVLEAIAKAEDIQVDEASLEAEITKMAEMYKMEADKLKDMMGDNEIEQIKQDIAIEKAVELVTNEAKETK